MRRLALEIIAHSLEATQLADLLTDFKKVMLFDDILLHALTS
jgi:hypothetical protein